MPIPLGILAAAGFRPAAAGDFVLLETQVLGSNQSSVTFSGLAAYASQYRHLQVRISATTSVNTDVRYQLNGDTGNNYAFHALYGTGSSVISGAVTSTNGGYVGFSKLTAASGNQYAAIVDFLDAWQTTKNKVARSFFGNRHSDSDPLIMLNSALWQNTSAITSISFYNAAGGTINATSRFSLYGVK